MSMAIIRNRACEKLEITPHISVDGRPYLSVAIDSDEIDGEAYILNANMTPDEIRMMALQWFAQAEVADGDAFLFESLKEQGFSIEGAFKIVQGVMARRVDALKGRTGW